MKKNYYNGKESDCGNYQNVESPHYESKDPSKHKFPKKWTRHYIRDWFIALMVAAALVLLAVNYF